MNSKQKKTLEAIFKRPVPADIKYTDVVAMLRNICIEVVESKSGSRVRLVFKGTTFTFHSPHPQKELKRYAVEHIREFLIKAGVKI